MIQVKLIEIRDAGTFIPAMAVYVWNDDEYLLTRGGFGLAHSYVFLIRLTDSKCYYDPYEWDCATRTMPIAHLAIAGIPHPEIDEERANQVRFEILPEGGVVDVEWLLGLRDEPKTSERNSG